MAAVSVVVADRLLAHVLATVSMIAWSARLSDMVLPGRIVLGRPGGSRLRRPAMSVVVAHGRRGHLDHVDWWASTGTNRAAQCAAGGRARGGRAARGNG